MTETKTEERKHHPYSPSGLGMREACPMFQSKQEAAQHERCIAGTKAHAVTETGIDDNTLSDEDAAAAAECMDFFEKRRALMIDARERAVANSGVKYTVPDIIEHTEIYLAVDDEKFEDDYVDPRTKERIVETVESTTAGYVDRAIINHDRTYAELFDWKFGRWPVEDAENNLQGIAYTLGLFRMYPSLQAIQFFFKQPHLESISHATFTRSQIPDLYLRVQVGVARSRAARHAADFSTARALTPACNFCALIGVCPKVAEIACKVGHKFHPIEIPENITPTMIHDPKNATLAKRLASVVEVWAGAFSRQLSARVLRGEAPVPDGYTLATRAERKIVNKDAFRAITLKYLTEAEYTATFEPTFGPLEKIINDKAPRGQKSATLELYKKELEDGGAVAKDIPYSFLKAVASKGDTNKQTQ